MRLRGKLTKEDHQDLRKLARSKWYWPKFIFKTWHGMAILGVLLWATVDGFIHWRQINWLGLGALWAVVGGLIGLVILRTKQIMKREFSALQSTLPEWVVLTDEGLRCDGPHGASALQPWSCYKGWREGKQVILVDRSRGRGFTILALDDLSEAQRQVLRGSLESHLPALKR